MATAKLPEIPATLPPPETGVRDDVYDRLERFVGPQRWSRNPDGTPMDSWTGAQMTMISSNGFIPADLDQTMRRIRNIPQWERGLNSKPDLRAEWDAYFKLLPKWIENVYTRLDEKNHLIGADDDASAESSEIVYMQGKLLGLQNAVDFAAQAALAPPPDEKFAPVQPADVKAAVAALDKEFESTRSTLTSISARGGAADEGPKLKDVFKAYRAYVKQWEATKGSFLKAEQVPTAETKKALAGFVAEAEAAWALDNPGKAPPQAAAAEPPSAGSPRMSNTMLWAAAGAIGLGALYLASRKR